MTAPTPLLECVYVTGGVCVCVRQSAGASQPICPPVIRAIFLSDRRAAKRAGRDLIVYLRPKRAETASALKKKKKKGGIQFLHVRVIDF